MKQEFNVNTQQQKQVIDLTAKINKYIQQAELQQGWGQLFVLHTTCAVTTADLDPGTDQDYLTAIEKMFPQADYNHPHDPNHVGDHIMSSLIGSEVSFTINQQQVRLGTWQRLVLIELNGPRKRKLVLQIHPDTEK